MENIKTPSNEELPISVYGDSYCNAVDVKTPSFAAYLSKYTNSRIVYNVSAPADSLEMVAGRVGGVPIIVSPCDIPRDKTNVEITLSNEYGTNLVPDFSKNAGLNPCKILGVEGVIAQKDGKLYFSRSKSGNEAIIASPTAVDTKAMEMRLDDITVFFVGSDNLFSNIEKTVQVYEKAVNALNSDKYLIIGPVWGEETVVKKANEALENKFGNKFLNAYDYLCNNAAKDYKIELTDENSASDLPGHIPSVFLSEDKNYFNKTGNEIVGKLAADTLNKLNYLS